MLRCACSKVQTLSKSLSVKRYSRCCIAAAAACAKQTLFTFAHKATFVNLFFLCVLLISFFLLYLFVLNEISWLGLLLFFFIQKRSLEQKATIAHTFMQMTCVLSRPKYNLDKAGADEPKSDIIRKIMHLHISSLNNAPKKFLHLFFGFASLRLQNSFIKKILLVVVRD